MRDVKRHTAEKGFVLMLVNETQCLSPEKVRGVCILPLTAGLGCGDGEKLKPLFSFKFALNP